MDTSDKDFDVKKPNSRPEQTAGDELVDWRPAKKYTPETVNLLAATGYLRTMLDITYSDILNLPVERYKAVFKLVEKLSEVNRKDSEP